MLEGILTPFWVMLVSELCDKTQICILLLATRTKKYLELFITAIIALLLADSLAIIFGFYISDLLEESIIKIISSMGFILIGILILVRNEKSDICSINRDAPFTAFILVFLSEFGDKTQISAGILAMNYNPVGVGIAMFLALSCVSIITIYLGKKIYSKVSDKSLKWISSITFIFLGLIFLLF